MIYSAFIKYRGRLLRKDVSEAHQAQRRKDIDDEVLE